MASTMEEKETDDYEVANMNIVLKLKVIEYLADYMNEHEIREAVQRIVCDLVLERAECDPLYAHKLKEALR